jgi:hypothetical protein
VSAWGDIAAEVEPTPELAERPNELYQELGADVLILAIRYPEFRRGGFDMHTTAANYKCHVTFADIRAAGGLSPHERKIIVSYNQPECEQELTVGHELGHQFLYDHCRGKEYTILGRGGVEEFCEFFAHRIVDEASLILPGQMTLFKNSGEIWGDL